MKILQEILTWSADRPAWQRDALRRLVLNGELSDGLPLTIIGGNLGIHMPTFYPELFSKQERSNPWNLLVTNLTFSLKDNDILFRDDPGRELKQNVQFPFFVALDEPGVFEREPLLPALNRISEFVSKTVCGFDSLFL